MNQLTDLPDDAADLAAPSPGGPRDALVVRYGQLYGPDTYFPDTVPPHPRIHVDDAARRTLPALGVRTQVITLVDDDGPVATGGSGP